MDHIELHYEWNEDKASANVEKHHVSFETACLVFSDPDCREHFLVFVSDDGKREVRYLATGRVYGDYWSVVYTPRNGRKRILSARRATTNERRDYDKAFNR